MGSAPGFLSVGVTAAVLRGEGTIPVVREEWVMCVMRGAREGAAALTRTVERGSSWQVRVHIAASPVRGAAWSLVTAV